MAYQDVDKHIRECKKCGEVKPFAEFVKSKNTTYGIVWTCLNCANLYKKRRNKIKNTITTEFEKNNISRTCHDCKENKLLKDFPINKVSKYGRANQCKECRSKSSIKRARNNPEKIKKSNKERYAKNKDIKKVIDKEYYQKNKDKIKKRTSEYRKNPIVMKKRNKRETKRRNEDLNYKLQVNLRGRLRHIVKNRNTVIHGTTEELLGCSICEFIRHIESMFTDGMNWDKVGLHGIHLDHIIPLSSFDLTKKEEQMKSMNYKNLQPLWAIDNLKKGSKLNWSPNE